MNPKVDFYFKKDKWHAELAQLRSIVLDSNLKEDLKWGCPCYILGKSNVILIHVFKEYCALLFFKGALLKDTKGVLIQQTANVQSARQMRFTNVQEIIKLKATINAYIKESIAVEEAGLKVELKKTEEYTMPEELQVKLNENKDLKTAFLALTPGRQRAYIFHISQAKQAKTREARVEKYIPQILDGKGLDD